MSGAKWGWWAGDRGRGREKISSRFSAELGAHPATLSQNPEIRPELKSRVRLFNQLSHLGTPGVDCFMRLMCCLPR